MKKLIVAFLTVMAASSAFADSSASDCGCTMDLTIRLSQTEPGLMRVEELRWTEATEMISKSEYLTQADRQDAAKKSGYSGKIAFFLLETTEYSAVKQEVLIVQPTENCKITGRYTTYIE